jgi:hypothetical protein
MPPVQRINCDDGISILTIEGINFSESKLNIQSRLSAISGNLRKKESKFNEWLQLQSPFAMIIPLADLEPDDRVLLPQPVLLPWEYIEGNNFVSIKMYIQVHIYNDNPLDFNIMIQNKQEGPITAEWW